MSRRIVIIGAGPGGICMGIKLKEAGFDDFVILERASGVGGTWQLNRYPGAECDVQSHLYSYSYELKKDWSRPYASQPEILEYLEHCVDKYGLSPHIRLNTTVRGAYWDEECTVWRVVTESGDELVADAVVGAVGLFSALNWPDIPGLDTFEGTIFHSARWNHDHDLRGERVAVIGSAASAVQFVPEIAPVVGQLHLFQRTANWVTPKEDAPFTEEQIARFRDDPIAARQQRWAIWRRVEAAITYSDRAMMAAAEEAGRKNIAVVDDPETRRKLTPSVPYGSQRPLTSNKYYPTFNRDNVELVTDRIERITQHAILTADGICREVDTIILGTGFDTSKFISTIDITGRGGRSLADSWNEGARAYLGITTSGFPNLFMLYGPNTNNGSIIFMIECQVAYIVRQLQRMKDEGITWIDVRRDVMDRYNEEVQRDCRAIDVWQVIEDSYYRDAGRIVTQWPHNMSEYRRRTSTPDPDAYEVN